MTDIGRDTIEMESMRALSCKYSLAWSGACAVVQSFKTNCTHGLHIKKKKGINYNQKSQEAIQKKLITL
ncbi:hypothetical protein HanIR_Chr17g0882791 [Helianthus annuus]|nr:hypothetical protein HanIR_Chr17g0882791 [Helianthus annuus]